LRNEAIEAMKLLPDEVAPINWRLLPMFIEMPMFMWGYLNRVPGDGNLNGALE